MPLPSAWVPWKTPVMIERELEVVSRGNRLCGSLCLPHEGSSPLVLMIHGSGPLDRNENIEGLELNIFNAIAYELAAQGIASVRYDKRGCGQSEGDYYSAGYSDLVADAAAWIEFLQAAPYCGPLFLLGHSEGGLIASQVSLDYPQVAGLVLLCPFIARVDHILLQQARTLEQDMRTRPGISGLLQRLLMRWGGGPVARQEKLVAVARQSTTDTFRLRGQTYPARWFRELFALESSDLYARVGCPLLLIGGGKDIQCDPAGVHRIAALVNSKARVQTFPDLTHILRSDEQVASFQRYAELLQQPVDPAVLQTISGWLAALSGSAADPVFRPRAAHQRLP